MTISSAVRKRATKAKPATWADVLRSVRRIASDYGAPSHPWVLQVVDCGETGEPEEATQAVAELRIVAERDCLIPATDDVPLPDDLLEAMGEIAPTAEALAAILPALVGLEAVPMRVRREKPAAAETASPRRTTPSLFGDG